MSNISIDNSVKIDPERVAVVRNIKATDSNGQRNYISRREF